MERAVPDTTFTAPATLVQLRSGIFVFAISSTCAAVTLPTLVRFGSPDPFAIFAARFRSTARAGSL